MLLPVVQVYGSTGHPTLGVTNTIATQPTTYAAGTSYVNVTAGTATAKTDLGATGYFAIDFGTFGGTQLVTFSGAQFSLYLSKDGLAQISSTDIKYAGPTLFSVSDLTTNAGWHAITEANGTFYIGQTTGGPGVGQEVITGPIPIKISNDYKYIKIFDGTTTAVAVSAQDINIQPGLTLTPTSGPAGTTVTAFGGGFPSSTVIDLVYSYTFYEWTTGTTTPLGNWSIGVNTGTGYFSSTAPMIDSKQAYNPDTGLQPISYINIIAKYQAYPHYELAVATFNEVTRTFVGVKSYNSGHGQLEFQTDGLYGNDTSTAEGSPNLVQPIPANVLGTINIAGNHSLVLSTVTFWIGTTQVGTSTTNGLGYYNFTISVPVLPAGDEVLKVINNGVTYEFTIDILPTLVLTPSTGPVGTKVTVTAYGFAADTKYFLYWFQYYTGDDTYYQIAHGTTGTLGTFNVTVTFVVPHSFGGGHDVVATFGAGSNVSESAEVPPGTTEATTTFTVTGTLVICNGTTCGAGDVSSDTISINANTRTMLSAVGTGLYPYNSYQVNIDNALWSFGYYAFTDGYGNTYINFTAAGFAPGLHQVEFVFCSDQCLGYGGTPNAWAFFNVTTIGAYTVVSSTGLPTATINEITSIYNNVNTIVGWQTTIFGMNTNVNTLITDVGTINTNVGTILGWAPMISNINSTVTGLKTTLGTISTDIGTMATDLGTTSLASVYTAAQGAASSAATAATAANNAKSSVSDTETYVLVVAVLVAITLVLELAVLIRKLD